MERERELGQVEREREVRAGGEREKLGQVEREREVRAGGERERS